MYCIYDGEFCFHDRESTPEYHEGDCGDCEYVSVNQKPPRTEGPNEAPGSTAKLRVALEAIRDKDQRRQYETCPDCMYDECQKTKKCRTAPYSLVGKIAIEALRG